MEPVMYVKSLPLCFFAASCVALPTQAEEIAMLQPVEAIGTDAFLQRCETWDKWDKPAPPFQIHGNTHYVGTCGISAILVTGDDGHILLDSGVEVATPLVLENIRKLGFDSTDIDYVLMSHEHFDHVAGHAAIAEATGAKVVASARAKPVLESGVVASDDPQVESNHPQMAPVKVDLVVSHGDIVALGGITITAHATPGHTPGALSWSWTSCDASAADQSCRDFAYVDSLSPVSADSYRFIDHPRTVAAFRQSIETVAALPCDEILTPHPSSSNMIERLRSGKVGDGSQCQNYASAIERRLNARLEREAGGDQ
ncbi:MAG: subclass B3 metallo-beta-lactamase [Altererythrobacter sp.]|nr:subclass B3 metallo-beta-lactamase [Altererythrobacter sp.]